MSDEFLDENESSSVLDRVDVVDRFKEWAEKWSVTEVPYVAGLLKDLPEDRHMTMWASRDPFEYLPDPEPKRSLLINRLARRLTLFRNLLVFVPVALTWMAISKATNAFAEYSDTLGPGETSNFLHFWQAGGPLGAHLSGHWRIGFIAATDAVIIAMIITATLIVSLLHTAGAKADKAERLEADTEREQLAIELGIVLASKIWATPESVGEAVQRALTRLEDALHTVNDATGRLDQTAKTVLEAALGVSGLATHMDALSASSTQLGTGLDGVSERIAGGITRAVDDLGQAVSEFRSAATGDTARAVQAVADFRLQVTNDSTEALEAVANISRSVASETARTLETITGFNDRVASEVLEMLNGVVAGLENINDRLEDSSERLVASNRSVGHGTDRLRQDLDSISEALGRMTDRLRRDDE
jgi:methyl-accepting chemotaxis protein